MKYLLFAAASFVLVAGPATAQSPPPSGFTAVFNGRDLDGWYGWAIHDKEADPKSMRARHSLLCLCQSQRGAPQL